MDKKEVARYLSEHSRNHSDPRLNTEMLFEALWLMGIGFSVGENPLLLSEVSRQLARFREERRKPGAVVLGFWQMAESRSRESKEFPSMLFGIPIQADPFFDKVLVIE